MSVLVLSLTYYSHAVPYTFTGPFYVFIFRHIRSEMSGRVGAKLCLIYCETLKTRNASELSFNPFPYPTPQF